LDMHKSIIISIVLLSSYGFAPTSLSNPLQKNRNLLGQIHGLSIYTEKMGANVTSWRSSGGKELTIVLSKHEAPIRLDDINNDRVVEIWTGTYQGEEVTVRLYQIDIRNIVGQSNLKIEVKPIFQAEGSSLDNPLQQVIAIEDVDHDGNSELLVMSRTHPIYGSLYKSGEVQWIDVYELRPFAVLANAKYKKIYHDKRKEILKEIDRLNGKVIPDLRERINKEPEHSMVYELRVQEAEDQIRVYKTWLERMNNNKQNKGAYSADHEHRRGQWGQTLRSPLKFPAPGGKIANARARR